MRYKVLHIPSGFFFRTYYPLHNIALFTPEGVEIIVQDLLPKLPEELLAVKAIYCCIDELYLLRSGKEIFNDPVKEEFEIIEIKS